MSTEFERLAIPSEVRKQILGHLERGNRIDAIKTLKNAVSHLELKEAKEIIEEFSPFNPPREALKPPPQRTAEVSAGSAKVSTPLGVIAFQFFGVLVASHAIASVATQGTAGIVAAVILSIGFAYFGFMKWPPKESKATEWTSILFALYQLALPAVSYFYFKDAYFFARGPEASVPVVQALTAQELGKVVSISQSVEVLPDEGAVGLREVRRTSRGKSVLLEFRVYPIPFGQAFIWTDVFRYSSGSNARIETPLFRYIPMEQAPQEVVEAIETIRQAHDYAPPAGVLRPLNERNVLVGVMGLWALVTLGIPALHLGLVARGRAKSNKVPELYSR